MTDGMEHLQNHLTNYLTPYKETMGKLEKYLKTETKKPDEVLKKLDQISSALGSMKQGAGTETGPGGKIRPKLQDRN